MTSGGVDTGTDAGLPSIGVVVPSHNRPQLLRQALRAVAAQTYAGRIETVVVFDRVAPDGSLEAAGPRPVRVLANTRSPGLAGTRNTGILSLATELVAFCDDDDEWRSEKLERQVAALDATCGARFATTAIEVDYEQRRIVRRAGQTVVQHEDLLRSRMSMLHSSTFLADRKWLLTTVGMPSEDAPGSQNEDWDLLLRATRHGVIAHVDEPLVRIRWGATSYFARQWEARAEALHWILRQHPDILESRVGSARVFGQLAFAAAAVGQRRECAGWARRALLRHPKEWRAGAALAVACGLMRADKVQDLLHRTGHGV